MIPASHVAEEQPEARLSTSQMMFKTVFIVFPSKHSASEPPSITIVSPGEPSTVNTSPSAKPSPPRSAWRHPKARGVQHAKAPARRRRCDPARRCGISDGARSRDQVLEVEMVLPELAAIVAGGDVGDALLGAAFGDGVEARRASRRRPTRVRPSMTISSTASTSSGSSVFTAASSVGQ